MESRFADCCPKCGLTREEFLEKGEFGCAECFDFFAWEARMLLLDTQGSAVYKGERPGDSENRVNEQKEEISDIYDKEYSVMFPETEEKESQPEQNDGKANDFAVILELSGQLKEAVEKEDYELAAGIRDKLKMYQSENKDKTAKGQLS